MATLDFNKLEQDGIDTKQVLDFVKSSNSNFNHAELEKYYESQGFNQAQINSALYNDLKTLGTNLNIEPLQTTPQLQPTSLNVTDHQDDLTNTLEVVPTKALDPTKNTAPQNELLAQTNTNKSPLESSRAVSEQDVKAPQSSPSAKSVTESQELYTSKKPFSLEDLEQRASKLDSLFNQLTPDMLKSKEAKKQDLELDSLVQEAIENRVPYAKLPEAMKQHLTYKGLYGGDLRLNKGEREYKAEITRQSILKVKNAKDLSQEQKSQIYRDRNILTNYFNSLFKDENEDLKEYQENLKSQAITKDLQKAITLYDNIAPGKSVASLIFGSDPKEVAEYRKGATDIAKGLGFDNLEFSNKGEIYAIKDNKTYKVNDSFFDNFKNIIAANAGSITGSLVGSLVGAAKGASRGSRGGLVGTIAGGAIGAFVGGAGDAALTNFVLNRDQNFNETIKHATQEGLLSVVGDVAFMGAAKAIAKVGDIPKALGRASDYLPVVGTLKRAMSGNDRAAQRLINQVYTPEQEQALKEFGQSFGGGTKFENAKSPLREKIASSFGEDSGALKAFDSAYNILTLPTHTERQEGFIRAIRADESGNLLAFLTEAANSSVQAHNTLKSILNKTTANLKEQLENLQLNKGDIKAIFDDLEKGTKESYNDAIDKTIPAVLTNDIKTTLNPENKANGLSFNQFKAELKDQGLDQEAKGFLNVIEKNIYNPAGVNFRQLNSSLKLLNAYHKNTKDPNFKDYINRALEGFLRRDIKAGIDNLFEQLPKNKVDQYKELYNTALNDYATMKQTLKDVKKLGLRDAHNSTEKALDSLIKFTKGQGDKLDNLSAISKGLSNSNREVLELNMLDRLFKKSLVDAQDISVLDSFKFMNALEELKESSFKTQGAKDFIEIAKGFHRLFNQDSAIAKALKPTTGGTIGSSIATSVGGAAQFQVTKAAFGFIVRTLPYIPFAKALNDKVSGAALRYHIKAALNKSHSIEAFKQNLNKIASRAEFSNATRALIREIEQNLPKSVEGGGTQTNIEGRALQNEVPVKVQDQAQVVKAQEIQDTELAPKSVGNTPAAEQTLPTKTKLERDLAPQEIHEVISKWDLSATSNKSGKQRLVVARVEAKEAEELTKALEFTGERDLVREIDSHQVIHALKQHGDIAKEAQRGQIAINLEDISHYIDTIKEADFKHIQDNRRVLYAKQVNGHVVVIEEALSGQDKLRFFDMWKQRGKLNKEVLLSHSQRPNTTSSLNLEGHMPSNITTPPTPSSKGYDLDRTLSRGYQPEATKSPLKSQETNTNNYIDVEVIDHPKALPYKTTGQIYKEAKAKGLSYVEFKALRDQEKATRALHTTRYIEFKKAESQNIKDLLDSSKPLRMLKPTEITERLLDQVKKHNAKVWVGELKDLTLANQLKLDTNHPIKITFNGSSLTHVEKQHGQHSIHYLKNKQPPVGIQDIREYPKVINEADVSKIIENKDGQKLLASAKQINGYFMVVETISTKHNELKLKTLYKENGEWSKNKIFSDNGNMGLRLSKDSEDSLSPKPSVHLDARPQVTTPDSSSLPLKNQDELTPEVQELLTKIRQDWNNKVNSNSKTDFQKAVNKHLGLENGNYSPNLSPDVKKALKHSYDQDSLSIAKGIEIDYPIKATQTLPYFKTALENPDYLLQNLRGELKFIKKIDEDHYAVVQWNRYFNSFDPKKDTPYWRLELWDQESLKSELKYTNSTDPIDLARGFTSKQIHNGQLGFSKEEVNKWRLEELERSNAHKAALQKDIEEMVKEETSKKNTKPKKAKDYNQPEKISLDNLYKVSTNLPVNASFGKNYTSYRWNGKKEKAIEGLLHLMYEKTRRSGQIAPAFYRQDLGGIDVYTQFELKSIGGSGIKDQPSKGLELLKDQPQDFLTPVGQANKDFQKWRNTHLAAYITKTILEGDVIEVGHNKVILSMRDTYNGKIWDIEAGIHFTNNADPSQPKRYMLEEFKVREVKEKPALSRSEGKTSTTKSENQEIPHNKAFGTNFKEFYHDPKGAIAKLIEVKEGQVAGAFYREDLGDIDLVWGEIRDQGGKLKGHGLAKIVEKHLDDFKGFEGNSALEKLGRGLEEIVENGKVVMQENQRATIVWHEGKHLYKVGLKNNWMGKPTKNRWIVTAYQDNKVKEKP